MFGAFVDLRHAAVDALGLGADVRGRLLHFVGTVRDGAARRLDVADQLAQVRLHVGDGGGQLVHLVAAQPVGALGCQRFGQVAPADLERAPVELHGAVRDLLEADGDGQRHPEPDQGAEQRVLGREVLPERLVAEYAGEHAPQGQVTQQDLLE